MPQLQLYAAPDTFPGARKRLLPNFAIMFLQLGVYQDLRKRPCNHSALYPGCKRKTSWQIYSKNVGMYRSVGSDQGGGASDHRQHAYTPVRSEGGEVHCPYLQT
jgi:hypothetical protein